MSSDALDVERAVRRTGRTVRTGRTGRTVRERVAIQAPPPPQYGKPQPRWQRWYRRAAVGTDLTAVVVSAALYSQWGTAYPHVVLLLGAVVFVLAACGLGVARAWDPMVLGHGSVEFTRLLRGFSGAAVVVALFSLALQLPAGRPWVFGVLPIAGVLATVGRLGLRWELHRRRRAGAAMARVLAVGTEDAVEALVAQTRRAPHEGWLVVAACTPTGTGRGGGGRLAEVPVVGDLDAVTAFARSAQYDAVAVAQTPGWTAKRLQQLAWDLEGTETELVVEPGLMEVAGPRLHVDSLDGLPLLRLTHPTFTGAARLLKGLLDRLAALLLLLLTAPLLLVVAVAVAQDGGPVFFRQTRVGVGGREFRMVKFRSMVVDGEALRATLAARNEGAGPMFKMRQDPRVTRVGRVLRRFSVDELPQLFNVLGGTMSLVGPRPPLPVEVAGYAPEARRRLLVRPGMTGLWQVSGRSDLSWEESLRLDLRYVENWTLALDARILLLTARAVVHGDGAY